MDQECEFDHEAIEAVGLKVIEMADRVAVMHAVLPGTKADWCFEIDDKRFRVSVTVEDEKVS